MRLPECVRPVFHDEAVVLVLLVSHAEGRMSRVKDKDDDGEGEKIDVLIMVRLLCPDLGSHVSGC